MSMGGCHRSENRPTQVALLSLALMLLMILPGCQNAKVSEPLTAELSGNDMDAQLRFWHTMSDRKLTSNDEAFHGLLLYLDGKDDSKDYANRVSELQSRKMLPAKFTAPAEQAVTRGTLAIAIVRILEIRGGINQRLFGPAFMNGRYAVRELEFVDLYPTSSTNQTFSGLEYLGIISRIEDYQRYHKVQPVDTAPAKGTGPVDQGQDAKTRGTDQPGDAPAAATTQPR